MVPNSNEALGVVNILTLGRVLIRDEYQVTYTAIVVDTVVKRKRRSVFLNTGQPSIGYQGCPMLETPVNQT